MSRKRQEQRREERRQQHQREVELRRKREAQRPIIEFSSTAAAGAMRSAAAAAKQLDDMLKAYTYLPPGPATYWAPPPPAPAPAPPRPAPTFSECVIGYRRWRVDASGQLRAITMTKQVWTPGVNTASCRPGDQGDPFVAFAMGPPFTQPETHPAPAAGCHCGLYGWNDYADPGAGCDDMDPGGGLLAFGAIAAWGHLQVHAKGFRAEHACVVALAHTDATTSRVRATLERVGAEYRVPVVHVDTLQAEAERHGTPLPADVRPQPPLVEGAAGLWRQLGFAQQIVMSPNQARRLMGGP